VSKETLGTRAFDDPPAVAAWRHCGARDGFEVVFATSSTHGWRFEGSTAAIEGGCAWQVGYTIEVDRGWSTLSVHLVGRSLGCGREVAIERGADGTWHVNGRPAPALDGCTDVDLESSVLTNTFPVRRLRVAAGATLDAPAVYVKAADLVVTRIAQTYTRLPDDADRACFHYQCPDYDADLVLRFGEDGLVAHYPGLAVRVVP